MADEIRAVSVQSDSLTKTIIGEAMYVHPVLGPGFLESIYHNALLIRLRKLGLSVESQKPLPVWFDGEVIGDFVTDLVVNSVLILELKAVSALSPAHEVQLVNYLTATKLETGLLLNFGAKSLEVKRKSKTLAARTSAPSPLRNPVNHVNPVGRDIHA